MIPNHWRPFPLLPDNTWQSVGARPSPPQTRVHSHSLHLRRIRPRQCREMRQGWQAVWTNIDNEHQICWKAIHPQRKNNNWLCEVIGWVAEVKSKFNKFMLFLASIWSNAATPGSANYANEAIEADSMNRGSVQRPPSNDTQLVLPDPDQKSIGGRSSLSGGSVFGTIATSTSARSAVIFGQSKELTVFLSF